MRPMITAGAGVLLALALGTAAAAQTEAYYALDGDAQTAYRFQGGALTDTFPVPAQHYASAVRADIFTLDLYDGTRARFALDGTPIPGALAPIASSSGQMLDGAATTTSSFTVNYITREVMRYDADFTNPTVLFTIPSGTPSGITVDPTTGDFLTIRGTPGPTIDRYSSTGVLLGSLPATPYSMCCLAYEASTDTLWTYARGSNLLVQMDPVSGAVLQTLPSGAVLLNPWGGEMTAAPPFVAAPPVPTLTEWAMILFGSVLAGMAGLTVWRRTRA